MDVRRYGVRRTALRDGGFRDRIIEAAAAVTDIEHDAALLGGKRCRDEAAVLYDIGEGATGGRRACIAMGEDVAGTQGVEYLRHQRARLHAPDMTQHFAAGAGRLAGRNGTFEWFE